VQPFRRILQRWSLTATREDWSREGMREGWSRKATREDWSREGMREGWSRTATRSPPSNAQPAKQRKRLALPHNQRKASLHTFQRAARYN